MMTTERRTLNCGAMTHVPEPADGGKGRNFDRLLRAGLLRARGRFDIAGSFVVPAGEQR
jgi:hypothetical protein